MVCKTALKRYLCIERLGVLMKYGLFIVCVTILIQVCISCKTAGQKSSIPVNQDPVQKSTTEDSGSNDTSKKPTLNDLRGLLLPY